MGLPITLKYNAKPPVIMISSSVTIDYQGQLKRAVRTLSSARMQVSIYNHQLCTIERDLWPGRTNTLTRVATAP